MATFTAEDIKNSQKFSQSNYMIRLIKRMHETHPHLASWLKYNIRDATINDYYVPATLTHACKVVEIDIPENLCKLLSCNAMKEKSECTPDEPASYYYVGDDGYDVQCQPSCYNTIIDTSRYKDGKKTQNTPTLMWNPVQSVCRQIDTLTMRWLEKPFYRSDTKYELRLNDMPTGFSRITDNENPFGPGVTYALNKSYCKYYDRTLTDEGSCDFTKWESVLDLAVGMNAINTAKSGIRWLTSEGIPFTLPENLPKLPTELAKEHTVDGWKSNINKDFIIPDLIDTSPRLPDQKNSNPNKMSQNLNNMRQHAEIHNSSDLSNFTRLRMGLNSKPTDFSKTSSDISMDSLKFKSQRHSRKKRDINDGNLDDGDDDHNGPTERPEWLEIVSKVLKVICKSVIDERFWKTVIVNEAIDGILSIIKKECAKIVERMTVILGQNILKLTGSIGERVFAAGIQGLVLRVASETALRVAAKSVIALAKILSATASVVGWVLIGAMFIDLVFTFWDPFGYQNLVPKEFPKEFARQGELALRQALSKPDVTYTFEQLASLVFDSKDLMIIQLESLTDSLIYLDSLVVNSEGSRIDKGKEITIQGNGDIDDYTKVANESMTERIKFNPKTFYDYNKKFMVRIELNTYINYTSAIAILASGIFLLIKFNVICMILIFIAIIILAIGRMCLQIDSIVDILLKYRNNTNHFDVPGYSHT
ncbi:P74 [Drosophila innubila nudivirus]|uniref:P74 n=1 Tax=Drosophila innubila nudivirus TaxID=2057187 RepID=A0A2H4UXB1_9VIRU|nr:P74 [Drosophila innubila nudivirus]ATZ81555.1 P74 [Drosophila innubila nudivirus]